MGVIHAALLGVVQGLTEFLPISSSAHLILARAVFGWDAAALGLAFDVACHVGTLVAVVAYFRQDLQAMLGTLRPRTWGRNKADARLAWLILVGTLPVVVVGGVFEQTIEATARTPAVIAVALAGGAVLFLVAERRRGRSRAVVELGVPDAVIIGMGQAAALVPGVSRSGATIAVGMLLGLSRAQAARFGFLLGLPAILAAAGREALEVGPLGGDTLALFTAGLLSSAVVGYATIAYLIRYLTTHSLAVFAVYRFALAAAIGFWLLG